ncbi:probable receptor-like protein kinase At2g23200 [Mangifera indica]|uniref:probable receptor-like protein kinase At2g23200 n=1 Tax=Mangifera indica TaxID=29780 RepID=UPI001CF95CFE|nr:probable receptor-like protein kinase At2g23200 [Mangifera indica]
MEKAESMKIHCSLLSLVLVFQFLSLGLTSSAYTLPDKFFINCGSNKNINTTGRQFTGDLNSISFFPKQSEIVTANNQAEDSLTLYRTARVFKQPSCYEFEINNYTVYVVRLHFFAFSSSTNLSTAVFNVLTSTSEFLLLENFTVEETSHPPVVKEFLLSITTGKFRIYFIPQVSSFAFVNAIEVFPGPENFIPDEAPHISPSGNKDTSKGLLSKLLHPIYRINVGGSTITQENDTLWRNWQPDDSYLLNPDVVKSQSYSVKPNYLGDVNEYIAPDFVYQTAQVLANSSSSDSNSNVTWSFNVSKNARHFVRLHFCDIVSPSPNVTRFNLYVDRNFSKKIAPYDIVSQLAAPFYLDFEVDSDYSGSMNVSVGLNTDSDWRTAFLNGLEIMELLEKSGSIPKISEPKKDIVLVVVGSVLGGLAFIGILAVVIFWGLNCRKPKSAQPLEWSPLHVYGAGSSQGKVPEGTIIGSPIPSLNLDLKIPFAEILYATNNFNGKLVIGKGGFGYVYKGTLRNGLKVAVKRSDPGSGQGLSEFQTEIMVLSKIRHRHLVSLIGYCDERNEMILVYEFMEKGTVRDHLYNSKFPSLSWKQRLEICIGAARGLHYLHKGSARGIIHRDVKSTNILLDENHVAKVADFGLSRLGPSDQTHVSTAVKGTFGYLDPEYFRSQQITEKSDVYSFGVVLLEVLCARPVINPSLTRDEVNLAEWAMLCKNKGVIEEIVDPLLKGQIAPNSLRKFIETAEKCLQEDGVDRPTMGDVLWDLEYALQFQRTATGEPHQDSTTNFASELILPDVKRFPSFSQSINEMPNLTQDSFISSEDAVFSQLNIENAR